MIGCGSKEDGGTADANPTEPVEETKTTTTHYLKDNRSTIDLDNGYQKSSRYRVAQDVPSLKNNASLTKNLQEAINYLEFEDAQLDVFVNPSKPLDAVFITKIDPLLLSKEQGQLLNVEMEEWLNDVNKKEDILTKVSSDLRRSPLMSYYKFQYSMHKGNKKKELNFTNYFVITEVKSYLITHMSSDDNTIESSIRTLSNGS